jgi:N-methylhydantoinase A/oxoprolinase/acetone carboxylase beta subunit
LITAVTRNNGQLNDLALTFTPTIPIVAVGGPAAVFYPSVGERLQVKTVIPENAAVANAVGAAIGHIKIRTVIEITKHEAGGYQLHQGAKPLTFADSTTALEKASSIASDDASAKARAMGGDSGQVQLEISRVDLPNMDEKLSLISATITAECLSLPTPG